MDLKRNMNLDLKRNLNFDSKRNMKSGSKGIKAVHTMVKSNSFDVAEHQMPFLLIGGSGQSEINLSVLAPRQKWLDKLFS